jgi:hypothetical protein
MLHCTEELTLMNRRRTNAEGANLAGFYFGYEAATETQYRWAEKAGDQMDTKIILNKTS